MITPITTRLAPKERGRCAVTLSLSKGLSSQRRNEMGLGRAKEAVLSVAEGFFDFASPVLGFAQNDSGETLPVLGFAQNDTGETLPAATAWLTTQGGFYAQTWLDY